MHVSKRVECRKVAKAEVKLGMMVLHHEPFQCTQISLQSYVCVSEGVKATLTQSSVKQS